MYVVKPVPPCVLDKVPENPGIGCQLGTPFVTVNTLPVEPICNVDKEFDVLLYNKSPTV